MSTIPGLERPAPVPNDLNKPFWTPVRAAVGLAALHRLPEAALSAHPTVQHVWLGRPAGVERGARQGTHRRVLRDTRLPHQGVPVGAAINFAVITLDEDPGINFLSNLRGPAGEVPVGAPVELIFEQTSTGRWSTSGGW